MGSQIELLVNLQRVDQSLREKQRVAEESQGRVAAIENALEAQTAAAAASRADLDQLTARQRDLEAKLAATEAKLRDRRMRVTRIRNEKELGLAKREMDILKDEVGTLETELVTVMEQVEAATAKLAGIQAEVATLTAAMDTEVRDLREAIGRLTAEMELERAKRQSLVGDVDAELRRRYELLFARRGGMAVVGIRGGICQGCHMNVPPQLFNQIQRGEQVIVCPNCQRILYWQPEREEKAAE